MSTIGMVERLKKIIYVFKKYSKPCRELESWVASKRKRFQRDYNKGEEIRHFGT